MCHLLKSVVKDYLQELEVAMLEKRVDLAVHSLKDMPTVLPTGLVFLTNL